MRIMKKMKILELHKRTHRDIIYGNIQFIKFIKFHIRKMKIINHRILSENHENCENLEISCENNEKLLNH